jgi:hypothetical protein
MLSFGETAIGRTIGAEPTVRAIAVLVLGLLSVPALAAAQPEVSAPPFLGPIGLPLPAIGGPLPAIGLPPLADPGLPAAVHDPHPRRPQPRTGGRGRAGTSIVYVMPVSPWPLLWFPHRAEPSDAARPAVPEVHRGRLRLDVEPAGLLQVFVDGVYVGLPGDFGGELDLPPGVRRVDLRAPGHEPVSVDVQVLADRTVTYRGALDLIADEPPARAPEAPATMPEVPIGSRIMYEIPGCYMGNVPPADVALPPGCDPSLVRIFTP